MNLWNLETVNGDVHSCPLDQLSVGGFLAVILGRDPDAGALVMWPRGDALYFPLFLVKRLWRSTVAA